MNDWKLQGTLIGLLSALALGGLLYILYGRTPSPEDAGRFAFLPAMNAACNAVTTFLIIRGLVLIHHGEEEKHRQAMLGAFVSSTLFLIGYVAYYFVHGETHFLGQGTIRHVYFSILVSHIILSAVALPLVLMTFYLALSGRFDAHAKLAKVSYPIWLYVSITGVVVFFFLRHFSA